LADRSRRLVTRTGFFSPSLDGGLPLFELFNPSWRSSSAIRDIRDSFSALSAAISVIRSSVDGAPGVSRIIRFLNRKLPPQSRKIYRCRPTWAVTLPYKEEIFLLRKGALWQWCRRVADGF